MSANNKQSEALKLFFSPENITKKYIADLDIDNAFLVSQIALQLVDPITDKIKILIADYMLKFRKQLLSGDEITGVLRAAKITGLDVKTIYNWIDKEIIDSFEVDGKKVVFMSQLKIIIEKKNRKIERKVA